MNAGMLNKRIIIQELATGSPAYDAFGQPSETWATFFEVWAAVEPIQGREFWAQQQVQSEVTVRIRLRYLAGVTTKMRVSYDSKIYAIISVIDPKERHAEMQLMCKEGVTDE